MEAPSPSGTYVIRSGAQSIRKGLTGGGFIKNVYVKEPCGRRKGEFKRFTGSTPTRQDAINIKGNGAS